MAVLMTAMTVAKLLGPVWNGLMGSSSCGVRPKKIYPSLRSFTKAFLNMKTLASAPWTNTKGADTTMMLQFLVWFVSLQLLNPPAKTDARLLQMMLKLAKATLAMFSGIHGHGLWMERTCGSRLYIEIMRVLRGYQLL